MAGKTRTEPRVRIVADIPLPLLQALAQRKEQDATSQNAVIVAALTAYLTGSALGKPNAP